jgi:hypothetical protein
VVGTAAPHDTSFGGKSIAKKPRCTTGRARLLRPNL